MTATTAPRITVRPSRVDLAHAPVWLVGAAAGVVAAVATTLVAVAAKAADVPMRAAPRTEDVGRAIPIEGFALSTLGCTAVGVVLAVALVRWAKRTARTFVAVTMVLTLVSFAGPVTTGHATTATRLVLALTHVVAAAIVIPAVARCLAERPARRSA